MSFTNLALRILAVGALIAVLVGGVLYVSGVAPGLAAPPPTLSPAPAGTPATPGPGKQGKHAAPVVWAATSPATHKGDHYTLAITNGPTAQQVSVMTTIMDHSTHTNTPVIQQTFTLAPGETKTLAADNTYGTANHFQTRIGSQNQDLTFTVTIADSQGTTATFNQRAFWVHTAADRPQRPAAPHPHPRPGGPAQQPPPTPGAQ